MHLILFDIDGTLLTTNGAGLKALNLALQAEFGAEPVTGLSTSGRTDRSIAAELFSARGIENNENNWLRFCASYLAHLKELLPGCRGSLLPGVAELLQHLAERSNLTLGLLTGNVHEGAKLKLQRYQADGHFLDATGRLRGGFGDDHPQRNDVARQAWEVSRKLSSHHTLEKTWIIGDTPRDIECARAIGARAIGVATGGYACEELQQHQPDLLLENLLDTELLLAELN